MSDEILAVDRMRELIEYGRLPDFVAQAHDLEPADLADVLTSLDEDTRVVVMRLLPPELLGKALAERPEQLHAGETLAALEPEHAAEIVEKLPDDEAADILGELEADQKERILRKIEDRASVDKLLQYEEDTAGGIMTGRLVAVQDNATASQALEDIRLQAEESDDFYQVFVIDGQRRLVGALPLKVLVVSQPDRPVREIMTDADIRVTTDMDQEAVARVMTRYDLPSVPVVDAFGRLVGRVTFDDVMDVVQEEGTEDLLRFGGGSGDEDIGAGWASAVKSRLPWLYINLFTAFLAAAVVVFFQGTLERIVILSAWMPVVAGMGGNAGTQALAVTVRRLALGQVPTGQFARVIWKESVVGILNGVAIGVVVCAVALAMGRTPMLGVVVFLAMTGNLFVAGFAGAFIPILLERFRIDPAVASSIFVTTFTDMFGFFLLLGLASRLL
ncbi:MAG: magnesium transporter [Gemmatimonadales bacterium]